MEFHVGDVVELTVDHPDGNEYLYAGDIGVVGSDDGSVAVEFETLEGKPSGHSCYGIFTSNNGWWVGRGAIRLVESGEPGGDDVAITEDELAAILMMK